MKYMIPALTLLVILVIGFLVAVVLRILRGAVDLHKKAEDALQDRKYPTFDRNGSSSSVGLKGLTAGDGTQGPAGQQGPATPKADPNPPSITKIDIHKTDGDFATTSATYVLVPGTRMFFDRPSPVGIRAVLMAALEDAFFDPNPNRGVGLRVDDVVRPLDFDRLYKTGRAVLELQLPAGAHVIQVVVRSLTLLANPDRILTLSVDIGVPFPPPAVDPRKKAREEWFKTISKSQPMLPLTTPPVPKSVISIPAFALPCSCVKGTSYPSLGLGAPGFPGIGSPINRKNCSACGGTGYIAILKG